MVGVFAKSPRGRANALRSKYFSDDRIGMTRISPTAALQSEAVFDSFQPAEVLQEPFELDQPIQCPSPESSILENVEKKRIKVSWKLFNPHLEKNMGRCGLQAKLTGRHTMEAKDT